jgi:hypothetical protein
MVDQPPADGVDVVEGQAGTVGEIDVRVEVTPGGVQRSQRLGPPKRLGPSATGRLVRFAGGRGFRHLAGCVALQEPEVA